MKKYFQSIWKDTVLLFRNLPGTVVALFVIAVVTMNLLANKIIYRGPYLAIDGGILVSWLSFLCMDIITKHYGPRAANKVSIFAIMVNLLMCLIFYIISIIPTPGEDYTAFNQIFQGEWFILISSTIAFIISALVNNVLNWLVGRLFKNNPDGKLAFVSRSYISTFVAQFVDNFVFAILAFVIFAPHFWEGFVAFTLIQCITTSFLGAGCELAMEVFFSPIGYLVVKRWRKDNVGIAYINRERAA